MIETKASEEITNLHEIFFTTIHEYEKVINISKSKKINSTSCFEFSKDIVLRALVLALRNSQKCLQNQTTNYANIIDSKIKVSISTRNTLY